MFTYNIGVAAITIRHSPTTLPLLISRRKLRLESDFSPTHNIIFPKARIIFFTFCSKNIFSVALC